jgi:8-oxo-dGTP pyrophosphatase MutT (NUDIX family)
MNKHFIADRLLPIDFIESDHHRIQKDKARLELFLRSNQQTMREEFLRAGVLIPLVKQDTQNGWQVILTRRADHLKHHPGEISFPGGRYETSDQSLHHTAIRETNEEIGIAYDHIELIGKLPTQATVSQYYVTPYVAIVEQNYQLSIDENEVAEAFSVPLEFILDRNNHQLIPRSINGQTFSYYQIEYNQYRIWGATAQMIVRLSEMLTKPTDD